MKGQLASVVTLWYLLPYISLIKYSYITKFSEYPLWIKSSSRNYSTSPVCPFPAASEYLFGLAFVACSEYFTRLRSEPIDTTCHLHGINLVQQTFHNLIGSWLICRFFSLRPYELIFNEAKKIEMLAKCLFTSIFWDLQFNQKSEVLSCYK